MIRGYTMADDNFLRNKDGLILILLILEKKKLLFT
jgi:hypothetical protein